MKLHFKKSANLPTLSKVSKSADNTKKYSACIQAQREQVLNKALNDHEFADVTFIIGKEKKQYVLNRTELSKFSPVFKAMLFGKMMESKLDCDVIIDDIEPEIFECIVNFCY